MLSDPVTQFFKKHVPASFFFFLSKTRSFSQNTLLKICNPLKTRNTKTDNLAKSEDPGYFGKHYNEDAAFHQGLH